MKLVVGIGNPEAQYEKTRHNVGFRVLDRLAGARPRWSRQSSWTQGRLEQSVTAEFEGAALLLKPLTYVNRTGLALAEVRRAASEPFEAGAVLVVCDDVNLDYGKLRLRAAGSGGGHHGLESLIEALGTDEFVRLRVGVRNERMPKDLAGFVLERFSSEEEKGIDSIIDKAAEVCRVWAREDFGTAMNRLGQLQSVK